MRRIERRIEKHRRDKERQSQLGIENERRHARNERQRRPSDRDERRIRYRETARDRGQQRAAEEQRDDDLEDCHQRTL